MLGRITTVLIAVRPFLSPFQRFAVLRTALNLDLLDSPYRHHRPRHNTMVLVQHKFEYRQSRSLQDGLFGDGLAPRESYVGVWGSDGG